MKLAIVFEKDMVTCKKTAETLKMFGYISAPVRSAGEAFNIMCTINPDVIVICAAASPEERRLIPNELKRLGPDATIILIADNEEDFLQARTNSYPGVDAVIRRPASVDAFRRVLDAELDPGSKSARIVPDLERRKR